jgi:hypothetical protein
VFYSSSFNFSLVVVFNPSEIYSEVRNLIGNQLPFCFQVAGQWCHACAELISSPPLWNATPGDANFCLWLGLFMSSVFGSIELLCPPIPICFSYWIFSYGSSWAKNGSCSFQFTLQGLLNQGASLFQFSLLTSELLIMMTLYYLKIIGFCHYIKLNKIIWVRYGDSYL